MNDRGKILHPDRKQQINDFSGLRYENITPTDIDGLIEYKDKAYVFLEIKYGDAKLPYGQRLAIERLIKDVSKTGKSAIAIVAQHDVFNTKDSVPVAECEVREVYLFTQKQWRKTKKIVNVKQCIDGFIDYYVCKNKNKYANTS
jgi:beta-xylosidase